MTSSVVSRILGTISIIVSLAVAVGGILFFGWDWREIIVLYWLTNITIGIITLIDIFRADISSPKLRAMANLPSNYVKTFTAIFFCFHYGAFTLGHGVFVFILVSGNFFGGAAETTAINFIPLILSWLAMSVAAVIAKLIAPYQPSPIDATVKAPYRRIVALHLTIIFGVFIIQLLGLPAAAALLLVGLNTIFELYELHKQNPSPPQPVAPQPSMVE